MEFRVVGRSGEYDLFGLCHPNGFLVMRNSVEDFSDILKYDGFQKAVKLLKPAKIAFERTTKRKWFIRLMVNKDGHAVQ